MADTNALRLLLEEIQQFLKPVLGTGGDPEAVLNLLDQLGWHVHGFVGASSSGLPATIDSLSSSLDRVLNAAQGGEIDLSTIPRQFGDVAALFNGVRELPDAISAGIPFDVSELPPELLNALIVSYIARRAPLAFHLLELATLVRRPPLELLEHNGVVVRTKNLIPKLELARLGDLFTDPQRAFKDAYWPNGLPDADEANAVAKRFFPILGRVLNALVGIVQPSPFGQIEFLVGKVPGPNDLPAADQEKQERMMTFRWTRHIPDPDQWLRLGASLALIPVDEGGPGVSIVPFGGWSITIPLSDWLLLLSLEGAIGGLDIKENGVRAYAGEVAGARLSVRFDRISESDPIRIGPDAGPRVDIKNIGVEVSSVIGADQNDFKVMVRLHEVRLVLNSGETDGFLQKILPADKSEATFSFGIGWSRRGGFHIEGSSALQIRLPLHLELGPITFSDVIISALLKDGQLPVETGVTIGAMLGPLKAVVENVGLRVALSFPASDGNFGVFNLDLGLKPPNGVGLSIDAGVVKGGGYLFIDAERGEYAGALELTISDFLSLKAIGLITTRMPDGSPGFSLLIIITAEFSPGLQLGYGFALIGVGGLLGLNRTVVLEALALGVRTGAVNGILFPVDPVANAPRIISDLRTIFPPSAGRFLIGPMAKLGWGTPTLISLELGLIIEIPGNIAILGVLRLAIGADDGATVLQLQVNFIGAIEFDKKRAWFFAALFESRLLTITIEGEMGVLIAVGADANFLISIGGFHPQYAPPPLPFPSPRRIAFDIINTDYARIRVEGYFAVTTNTLQFGVRAQMFFGFSAFSVDGHFAFDALMRFMPPYFIVEVTAGATLKVGGLGVFSIDLALTLEGPTPWRARGNVSVSLLFIKFKKGFDEIWGEAVTTTLPPIAAAPLLLDELSKAANWRTLPPPSHNLLVSLRKLDLPGDTLVLHPLGTLEISQNAVPLGFTLDKIGEQALADANRFAVNVKGGELVKLRDVRRGFAPAQFRQMNDAQKLSAPAFQEEVSGMELGAAGSELRTGRAVKRSLRYEVTTIDTYYRRFVRRFSLLGRALFSHFIEGAAVSKNSHSAAGHRQTHPFDDKVEVVGEQYAVVFTNNNRAAAGSANFTSESAAREWMQQATANDPTLNGRLHVLPATERSEAA